MLTCLGTIGGFFLVCGIGGFIVNLSPIRHWLDRLAHGLPMLWDWSELRTTDAKTAVNILRRNHYEKEF